MRALLRLHWALLPLTAGPWILTALVMIAFMTHRMESGSRAVTAAGAMMLLFGPLGFIVGLRADTVASSMPLGLHQRAGGVWILTALLAFLGAAAGGVVVDELHDPGIVVLRCAGLGSFATLAALILGTVYLVLERDAPAMRIIAFTFLGLVDLGSAYLVLKAEPTPVLAGSLAAGLAVASGLFWSVFRRTETPGSPSDAVFIPGPPGFRSADAPRRDPAGPRIHPSRGSLPDGAPEILGISEGVRRSKNLAWILFKSGGGMSLGFIFYLVFSGFIGSSGSDPSWIFWFQMSVFMQAIGSLKTWACFAHSPWPRRRAFAVVVVPWLSAWILLTLLFLTVGLLGPKDNFVTTRMPSKVHGAESPPNVEQVRFSEYPTRSLEGREFERRGIAEDPFRSIQDPHQMASAVSVVLRARFGIDAVPGDLLSMRPPGTEDESLVDGYDPGQAAWMHRIQEYYRPAIRRILLMREVFQSLTGLVVALLMMRCLLPGPFHPGVQTFMAIAVMLLGFPLVTPVSLGAIPESAHGWFMAVCGRIPVLTLGCAVGLIGGMIVLCYRAFREWTPSFQPTAWSFKIR